jgi:hypothetical protein
MTYPIPIQHPGRYRVLLEVFRGTQPKLDLTETGNIR